MLPSLLNVHCHSCRCPAKLIGRVESVPGRLGRQDGYVLPRSAPTPGDRRRHDELGHVLPLHSAARIMAASWFRQLGLRSAPVNKSFLLKKWYLDCVTTAGDAALIYLADLSWRRLSIQYSSLLTLRAGEMQRKSSLCRRALPARSESGIEVHAPQLGFRGTWRPLANAIKRKIFECEDGTIDWQCFQPKAQVELCFASHQTIRGLGYAECLTLSMAPWKLPLNELHWGRFLTTQDCVVWIDWRGAYNNRVILYNGNDVEAESVSESAITLFDGTRVELDRSTILRTGPLGKTVFPTLPGITAILPRRVKSIYETKWLSAGFLRSGDQVRPGSAIHEVVRWIE